jgi:hypothetical protein
MLLLSGVLSAACARHDAPAAAGSPRPDTATAQAIARDRPEPLVFPLAPAGAGQVTVRSVAPARATLDLPPAAAEVALPPSGSDAAAPDPASRVLKPPIPRGEPLTVHDRRGGSVTLDVRVDETGAVSDVALVEADADSLTVLAVTNAALSQRYYPALLGDRHVAVWTRQVFDLARTR